MTLVEQIKELKKSSKKRNFIQRFDLIINLKDIDVKRPENRIDEIFVLPKGRGKPATITLFSDSLESLEDCKILKGKEIEELPKNKKELKKLISWTTIFLAEPRLMPIVGKHLGKFLAPIGKMPKPVAGDVAKVIKSYKNAVKIQVKRQPVIHTVVGSEDMKEEDVAENIKALINFLITKLPKGKNNIGKVYLKLTMSPPVKLEVV